ncbi:MAG: Terminase-like family protein [Clostridia bacterium]|nr:MAG: Terminase-like family protein [Clostridia bacterium]
MANVVWQPQPRQVSFMQRPEYECLYGGAAGGGKSDALLAEALRQVDIPHYRAIIFRKTYPQLTELIDRSQAIYSLAFPKAKYNESKHVWTFPSGAKIFFGSMQHSKDKTNYQGKRYDFIAFDELTHFTWEEYSYMFSRNRPSKSPRSSRKTRVYIRATTNPGGIGHGWVKERFISAAPPLTPIVEEVEVRTPEGETKRLKRDRIFIPATVFDNRVLLEEDPNYLGSLALLPEKERNALLYGDWDSFTGQYFTEFRETPDLKAAKDAGCNETAETLREQRRWCHVIEPFDISKGACRGWNILRSYDFGYAKPFSCAWWAVDYDGVLYRIMEMYGCTKNPNEGVKWTPDEQFRKIAELERTHPWLKGRKIDGVADPAIWDASRGESVADTAIKYGIYFAPGDHERIPGWMQCHYRLQFDSNGYPRMYVFANCKAFIRTVPLMMYDETHPEDLDSKLEDHVSDEWRYLCMSRPIKPIVPVEPKTIVSDPLDQFKKKR